MDHQITRSAFPSKTALFILTGFLILCFIIGGCGFYRHEAAVIEARAYDELKAIADLKIRQITAWRQARLADARIYSTGFIRDEVIAWLQTPADGAAIKDAIKKRFQALQKYQAYNDIILAGTDGRLLLSLDPAMTALEPQTLRLVEKTVATNNAVFDDFFKCPLHKQIHLDVAAPVPGKDGRPAAVLILRSNPAQFLFPLIRAWPTLSKSAETLLVRRDGDSVVFLNILRHRSDPPLSIRFPLSRADLPAARAVLGETGIFRGHDYRGVDVVADIQPVPGSPWFMVAKADTDDILAALRYREIIIAIITVMLSLVAGISAGFIYKHQGKRLFQALYQSERDRRKTEAEFKTTLYSIGDAVITADIHGNIREMNPVAEKLTGWTEAEAKGRHMDTVFRIISEVTGEPVENPVQKVLEKGLIVGLANHTLLISKDGTRTPITDSGAPIRDENNTIGGVVLIFRDQSRERDINRLLVARLALLEYAAGHSLPELLQKAVDEAAILTQSAIGFYHFVEADQKNLSLQAWSTRTLQEFCKADRKNRHHPIDQAGVWVDCVRTRKPVIHNDYASLPHKKGMPEGHAPVMRELVAPVVRDGRVTAIIGVGNKPVDYDEKDMEKIAYLADVAWEITIHKRAEAALHSLASHQQTLLAAIPDIVMEVDLNKVYTWTNRAGYEFFGDDVIGKKADSYFIGEQPVYETVQKLFDGAEDTIYLESWQLRKDGHKRLLAWWCRVLKDMEGNAVGALSTARDITDQKTLEDQLHQAQKMESVGLLAGGIAHDFNNMLAVIIGYTEMALEQAASGTPIFNDLQEIQTAARRSADLTRQLLAFARKQTITPVMLDLNDTISSMLNLLRKLIGENIDLEWQPGQDVWPVKMDPAQIDQILANLMVNAKDAIAGQGSITIETGNVEFDETYCEQNVGFIPGKYVMIAVSDTGVGMDRGTRSHLFEPFFTTKGIGKGTGLGLSTVYGIIKQNNGFINVYSEINQGTTFKIYLPRADGISAEKPAAPAGENLRGNQTVLIVEDEEPILKLAASILTSQGYTAIPANNPAEALEIAKHHDGPIHLLVTDVVMPRMSGKNLQEKLAVLRPGIKCLFMSGYTANAIAHHGVVDEGIHFLQKPFSVKALAQKVRETLAEERKG